jgi:hypothetical protein
MHIVQMSRDMQDTEFRLAGQGDFQGVRKRQATGRGKIRRMQNMSKR